MTNRRVAILLEITDGPLGLPTLRRFLKALARAYGIKCLAVTPPTELKLLVPQKDTTKRLPQMLQMTADAQFAIMLALASLLGFAVTALSLRSLSISRRGLFVFWDGRRMRAVSPITVLMRLDRLRAEGRFRLHADSRLAARGNVKALAAVGHAVTEAFELPPPDRFGLTNRDCLTLLVAYMQHLHSCQLAARKAVVSNALAEN